MSEKTSWEEIKNGKPLPPIETQWSDGSGIKPEQRSAMTHHQFQQKNKTLGKRKTR